MAAAFRPVLPREHGVWGFVLGPWALGAGSEASPAPLAWALLGAALFAMMATTVALDGSRRSGAHPRAIAARRWSAVYAGVALLFAAPVLLAHPDLAWAALPAAGLGLAAWRLVRARQDRSFLGRLLPIVGLCALVPVAHRVQHGHFELARSGPLWAAMTAFALGSLLFVRACFRGRRARGLVLGCLGYHAALPVLGWAAAPGIGLSFLPPLARTAVLGLKKPPAPLVGVAEILALGAHVGLLLAYARA